MRRIMLIKRYGGKSIVSFFILWIYTWFVCVLQAIENDCKVTILFFVLLGAFSLFLSGFMFQILWRITEAKSTDQRDGNIKKIRIGMFLIFLITFAFLMMYLGGQFPGGMSTDTINQYRQAMNGIYNDWHPVLHTFLFFTIPLKTGNQLGLIVFLQLLYFSLAFTYLIYVLKINGAPNLLVGTLCIYIWINPFIASYMMYPWKDIAFTVFAMVLMAYYIQIICTRGKWLKKTNIFLLSIVTVVCSYMRHNAILFVAPLVIIVLFYAAKNRKIRAGIIVSVAIVFLLVKGLYVCLDVQKPGGRIVETVGLPLTVWCNVMQKNPSSLPKDTQEIMYSFATKESYENDYTSGSFNSIKFKESIDTGKINNMSYSEVLTYTWQCFRYAPKEFIEAVVKLTSVVWATDGKDGPRNVTIGENPWGIEKVELPFGNTFAEQVTDYFSNGLGKILFGSIGLENWLMLCVGVVCLAHNKAGIIHLLPLFCYNFGTMLLLSGRDYRFFLLNIPLWLPTAFLIWKDDTEFPEIGRIK